MNHLSSVLTKSRAALGRSILASSPLTPAALAIASMRAQQSTMRQLDVATAAASSATSSSTTTSGAPISAGAADDSSSAKGGKPSRFAAAAAAAALGLGTVYLIVESHGELHAEEKDKGAGKSGAGKGAAASEAVVEVVVPTVDLASSGRRSRASASSGGERPTLPNIGKFDDLEQDAKRCCMVETFDGCRVEIKKMTAMSPMKEAFLGISTSMGSASLPGGYMTSFSGFSGTEAGFVNGKVDVQGNVQGTYTAAVSDKSRFMTQFQLGPDASYDSFVLELARKDGEGTQVAALKHMQSMYILHGSYTHPITNTLGAGVEVQHPLGGKTILAGKLARKTIDKQLTALAGAPMKEEWVVGGNSMGIGSLSFFKQVDKGVQFGGELEVMFAKSLRTACVVGAKVNGATFNWQANLNSEGVAGVVLEQHLQPFLKMTLSASVDYAELAKSRFGYAFDFSG